MTLELKRFDAATEPDFYRLHSARNDAGWCRCVAWWAPSWDGWGERTEAQNLALRRRLCGAGEHDGYLLYAAGEPVGWCQAGPRDRLVKLRTQMDLAPDPETWALSCLLIAPHRRRQGLAAWLVRAVLRELRAAGVRRVEAYPRRSQGQPLGALDLWTGPEAIYIASGFKVAREDPVRPVLVAELADLVE